MRLIIFISFEISGNEPYILDIVTKLMNMFRSKGYVNRETLKPLPEYEKNLRKITFFMMLNTEASFKYDLMSDHAVSHLLNAIPQLPKCLLLACVWGLTLDQYFYESLAYTPIWFAFQFVENAVDSLKYADPYETLDRVENLVRSIYLNIARSDYRQMETVDKKIILNKYYDVTMDLLRHFFAPDADKFQNWSKNKLFKYAGYLLKHNLELILYCFDIYQNKPRMRTAPAQIEYAIYELMREREPLIDNQRDSYSESIAETLHKFNITLLNSLQNNVMQVNCYAFMYWVEVDIDEEHTLQRVVGEAAYRVDQLINLNECFEHNVSAQLKTIAIKPQTIEEIISGSTIGELITKLDYISETDEHLSDWLTAFISRGELVLGNSECLETLENHATHLSVANVKEIILFAANVDVENGACIDEQLIEICLTAFDHFAEKEILELIQYSIVNQKQHFSFMQLENFDQFIIEVFNKSTFSQNRNVYLKLLFQNSQLFYDKLFEEALTTEVQMHHMVDIIQATASIFKYFLDCHLKNLIESNERSRSQLLPKLISNLFFANIIDSSSFIIDNLYKKYLVCALQSNNTIQIGLLINTLLLISHKYQFDGICPPILVMSAQVLELCRWNIVKFKEELVIIVTDTIKFINEILKKYLPIASENDKKWILSKISGYNPLTQYYYQRLSLPKDASARAFDLFLHPTGFDIENKQQCIKFLCEYIARCTTKEINWLARNDRLLLHFWDAIHFISAIVCRSKNQNEIDCLRYCCNSFYSIVEVSFNLHF